MRSLLVLAFLTAPVLAYAESPAVSFEVADHGDSVEVIAHNVEMKGTPISSVRSRIEVPVSGQPVASRAMMVDGTVMLVEFDGISNRVLSVKTKLERPEVKLLAAAAKATQVGSDLHLTFPRHGQTTVAAKTETKPEIKTEAKPEIKTEVKPETKIEAKPETKTEAKPETKIEAKPAPQTVAPATTQKPPVDNRPLPAMEKESLATSPGLYAFGALVTLLACGYVLKKKKKDPAATSTIDVVAQRSLGNKSKVMWLSAGGREMLVAVTQQKVQMLGQWPKATSELPRATSLEQTPRTSRRSMTSFQQELAAETAAEPAPAQIPSSAVSGILKLRARTSGPIQGRAGTVPSLYQVNEDVATDDEDADIEWAKEILTASGGRR